MIELTYLLILIAAAYGWFMGIKNHEFKKRMRGWIELNIEEKHYNDFVELLNGFERFAKLKGFSVKHKFSETDKQLTIVFGTQSHDKERLAEEFEEYLSVFQDDTIISHFFDNAKTSDEVLEVTKLRNQLVSIKANLECERNNNEFLRNIIQNLSTLKATITVNNDIGLKDKIMKKVYNVSHSSGAIVGEGNLLVKGSNIALNDSNKSDCIDLINKLLELIEQENDTNEKSELKRLIQNSKEEIEEDDPNESRIERWLIKAKEISEVSKKALINGCDILKLINDVRDRF